MPNKEKVIKGLETCIEHEDCGDCPYASTCYDPIDFAVCLMKDVLALLKEQEAREPHYTTLKYLVDGTEVTVHHPECPRCIENGLTLWDAEIKKGQAFCKRCGQAVKWDEDQ